MIRLATEKDLDTINEIYNYEVLNSKNNVDTWAVTSEDRLSWFAYHQRKNLPVLVKDKGGTGEVIAWES